MKEIFYGGGQTDGELRSSGFDGHLSTVSHLPPIPYQQLISM